MSKNLTVIAKNIKKNRKGKGYSQDRLSKIANVSHNTIIKIESGSIQNPTVKTAQKIAVALEITIDDLLKE